MTGVSASDRWMTCFRAKERPSEKENSQSKQQVTMCSFSAPIESEAQHKTIVRSKAFTRKFVYRNNYWFESTVLQRLAWKNDKKIWVSRFVMGWKAGSCLIIPSKRFNAHAIRQQDKAISSPHIPPTDKCRAKPNKR